MLSLSFGWGHSMNVGWFVATIASPAPTATISTGPGKKAFRRKLLTSQWFKKRHK